MRSVITQETGLQAVCGTPLAGSIEGERPTTMGGITPWDWILDLKKKKLSQAMQSLCLLPDCRCSPAASNLLPWFPYPDRLYPGTVSQIKSIPLKLLLSGYFTISTRKSKDKKEERRKERKKRKLSKIDTAPALTALKA